MATARDPDAKSKALKDLLQYFRREPHMLYQIGRIAEWLRGGYPLERVEELMEQLVNEGLLRCATKQELQPHGYTHGYFLTARGLEALPPEDRSYGVI